MVPDIVVGHWRCTGPRSPEHQRERARAVREMNQSLAGSRADDAAEDAGPSRRKRTLHAKNSSESRVGEGAGRLPGIWKLKWGQVRVSCGVQFNAGV